MLRLAAAPDVKCETRGIASIARLKILEHDVICIKAAIVHRTDKARRASER